MHVNFIFELLGDRSLRLGLEYGPANATMNSGDLTFPSPALRQEFIDRLNATAPQPADKGVDFSHLAKGGVVSAARDMSASDGGYLRPTHLTDQGALALVAARDAAEREAKTAQEQQEAAIQTLIGARGALAQANRKIEALSADLAKAKR